MQSVIEQIIKLASGELFQVGACKCGSMLWNKGYCSTCGTSGADLMEINKAQRADK